MTAEEATTRGGGASFPDSRPKVTSVAHAVTAATAWTGLAMQFVLAGLGTYPGQRTDPTLLGYDNPIGVSGVISRLTDVLTYFTIWSNIVVAIVATMLAIDCSRDGRWLRALHLDSLVMISVTGLVYAIVLAPTQVLTGWQYPANFLVHVATPLAAVATFIGVGPRGWITWDTCRLAAVVPVGWAAMALLRGAVIDAYPYPFVDVTSLGYGWVALNLVGVAVLAAVTVALLALVDRWRSHSLSGAR